MHIKVMPIHSHFEKALAIIIKIRKRVGNYTGESITLPSRKNDQQVMLLCQEVVCFVKNIPNGDPFYDPHIS